MRTDEELISLYTEGDERALSILVDRYLKDVYNFLYKLTGDLQIAEDATQESFIKVWKSIGKYKRGNNFKNWLFRIARNTAIDHLRKRKEIPFSTFETEDGNAFVDNLENDAPLAHEALQNSQDIEYAKKLLAELSPEYREVLVLRESSEMTFAEIGELLGKPLNTVKSQYHRALASLRRLSKTQTM